VFVWSNFREITVKLIYTTLLAEIVSYCIECICLSGRHVTFHCVGTSDFSLVLLCLFKDTGDLMPTTAQDGGILNLYNAQMLLRPQGGLTAAACEEVPYREPRWYWRFKCVLLPWIQMLKFASCNSDSVREIAFSLDGERAKNAECWEQHNMWSATCTVSPHVLYRSYNYDRLWYDLQLNMRALEPVHPTVFN
jgi:hypothetical protein